MGTCSREGVGIVQQGYEEDYFEFPDGEYIGITELIDEAGGLKSPCASTMWAFDFEQIPGEDSSWKGLREDYRKESGRRYPPVFRVRITVEAEALGDAETAAWWREKQQQK